MKNNYIIPIIIVLSALVILNPGGLFKADIGNTAQGFVVKSISLANPPVKGQSNEWIVDTETSGWGQSISGNLNLVDTKYTDNKGVYPLSISGTVSDNKALFLIDNSNPQTIFAYDVTETHGYYKYGWWGLTKDLVPPAPCPSNTKYTIKGGIFSLICINERVVGVEAPVNPVPNVIPKVTLTVGVNGDYKNVELTSLGTYKIGTVGSVLWYGSGLEASSIGTLSVGSNYVAIAPPNTKNWKVASKSTYEGGIESYSSISNNLNANLADYVSAPPWLPDIGCYDTSISDENTRLANSAACSKQYFANKISPTNGLANKLLSQDVTIVIATKSTTHSLNSAQNGFLVDLGNIYASSPKLQFRIKSDWLAIQFPSGKPKVLSTSALPKPFRSGDKLTATISVQNIGDGTGNFKAQDFSCGNLVPETIYATTFGVGETKDIVFKLVSNGAIKEDGTCSGRIVDSGSLESASWSFTYSMLEPAECTEGTLYYSGGNTINICKNFKKVPYKTCEFGVIDNGNGWECASDPSDVIGGGNKGGGDSKTFEILLRSWLSSPLILVLIITIAILLITIKRKSK